MRSTKTIVGLTVLGLTVSVSSSTASAPGPSLDLTAHQQRMESIDRTFDDISRSFDVITRAKQERLQRAKDLNRDLLLTEANVAHWNKEMTEKEVADLAHAILRWSERRQVPLDLLLRIITQESHFNPQATNQNDNGTIDRGLMQINSNTYPWLLQISDCGSTPPESGLFDYRFNLCLGTYYLAQNFETTGDWDEALIRYNGSEAYLTAIEQIKLQEVE